MSKTNENPYSKIEDLINGAFSGETLKNALDFVEYLKASEFAVNEAEISYNGKAVCYMHLDSSKDYPGP